MYIERDEDYMSQPIDQISQSSYIKINKKFLQNLKVINQIEDISRFRHDSGSQSNSDYPRQDYESFELQNNPKQTYKNSPIKSNLYNQHQYQLQKQSDEEQKHLKLSSPHNKQNQKLQKCFKTKKQKTYSPLGKAGLEKKTSKIQYIADSNRNNIKIPIENTFEFYLLKKNEERNSRKKQLLNCQKEQSQKSFDQTIKQKQFKKRFHLQNTRQSNQKQEISRINYKKLLENQIHKNKQLEKQIYKLQSQLSQITINYEQQAKSAKKIQKQLVNSQKIKRQNKSRIKQLDSRLNQLKNICKLKKNQKGQTIEQIKKQNSALKQENEKYKIFAETLAESIYLLKGKKPKKLQDIWEEWKNVFQSFSKNKWTTIDKAKSPSNKSKTNLLLK